MRHTNFYVDSGTLRSLDGFNHGNRLDYLIIGDSTATLKSPEVQKLYKNYANYTTPNLPVMDLELHKALDLFTGLVDKVYLFTSAELSGALRKQEIFEKGTNSVKEGLLIFEGEDRGSYYRKQYLRLSFSETDRLCDIYMKNVEYILSTYHNVQIVPVISRFLGPRLPQYFKAYPRLSELSKAVNLDWLDPLDKEMWADAYGHLSDKAWGLLKAKL